MSLLVTLLDNLRTRTRRVLEVAESSGTRIDLTRGLTFSAGTALAPILPPSIPFSGVSAATALACPPVTRAVDLYTTAFLRLSWVSDAATLAWLGRPVGTVPAKIRDARSIQDIILHNRALWVVARDDLGWPLEAAHLPVEYWSYDETGSLVVLGIKVPEGQEANYLVFHGAKPQPFLDTAKVTLQHYAAISATMLDRSESPIALMELKPSVTYDGLGPGEEGYVEEFDELKNAQLAYAATRGRKGGSVTITPRDVDLITHQVDDDGSMLLGARDAVRTDVANFLNINVSMLDGSSGSSDYANTLQNRNEFLELSLALFLAPFTERLSMDDVTPENVTVTLNLPEWDASPADAQGNQGRATEPAPATEKDATE